jgi:hypothetical protein
VNTGNCAGGSTNGVAPQPATPTLNQDPSTFTGNAQGGASAAFDNCQPTILCNYIMRVL